MVLAQELLVLIGGQMQIPTSHHASRQVENNQMLLMENSKAHIEL